MTIKNQGKNVSAENEMVLVGASLDKTTGTLTLLKKNLYDDTSGSSTIDLHGIKLRIKKVTQAQLNALKTSNDPDDIEERETHLFLVPLTDENTEGVYREYIWSSIDNDFEILGSTQIDLDPIENDIISLKTLLDYASENNEIRSIRLDTIEATKVDKISGKGLSTNDYTTSEKQKLANIEAEANKYIHPVTHTISEVQGLQSELNNKVDKETGKGLFSGSYNDLTNIPNTFTPSSHTHTISDITDLEEIDLSNYVSISLLNDVLTQMKNDLNS